MATELYATTQVKQMTFTRAEIIKILIENIKARANTPYDFDYNIPYVVEDGDSFLFRFMQKKITVEPNSERHLDWKPLPT